MFSTGGLSMAAGGWRPTLPSSIPGGADSALSGNAPAAAAVGRPQAPNASHAASAAAAGRRLGGNGGANHSGVPRHGSSCNRLTTDAAPSPPATSVSTLSVAAHASVAAAVGRSSAATSAQAACMPTAPSRQPRRVTFVRSSATDAALLPAATRRTQRPPVAGPASPNASMSQVSAVSYASPAASSVPNNSATAPMLAVSSSRLSATSGVSTAASAASNASAAASAGSAGSRGRASIGSAASSAVASAQTDDDGDGDDDPDFHLSSSSDEGVGEDGDGSLLSGLESSDDEDDLERHRVSGSVAGSADDDLADEDEDDFDLRSMGLGAITAMELQQLLADAANPSLEEVLPAGYSYLPPPTPSHASFHVPPHPLATVNCPQSALGGTRGDSRFRGRVAWLEPPPSSIPIPLGSTPKDVAVAASFAGAGGMSLLPGAALALSDGGGDDVEFSPGNDGIMAAFGASLSDHAAVATAPPGSDRFDCHSDQLPRPRRAARARTRGGAAGWVSAPTQGMGARGAALRESRSSGQRDSGNHIQDGSNLGGRYSGDAIGAVTCNSLLPGGRSGRLKTRALAPAGEPVTPAAAVVAGGPVGGAGFLHSDSKRDSPLPPHNLEQARVAFQHSATERIAAKLGVTAACAQAAASAAASASQHALEDGMQKELAELYDPSTDPGGRGTQPATLSTAASSFRANFSAPLADANSRRPRRKRMQPQRRDFGSDAATTTCGVPLGDSHPAHSIAPARSHALSSLSLCHGSDSDEASGQRGRSAAVGDGSVAAGLAFVESGTLYSEAVSGVSTGRTGPPPAADVGACNNVGRCDGHPGHDATQHDATAGRDEPGHQAAVNTLLQRGAVDLSSGLAVAPGRQRQRGRPRGLKNGQGCSDRTLRHRLSAMKRVGAAALLSLGWRRAEAADATGTGRAPHALAPMLSVLDDPHGGVAGTNDEFMPAPAWPRAQVIAPSSADPAHDSSAGSVLPSTEAESAERVSGGNNANLLAALMHSLVPVSSPGPELPPMHHASAVDILPGAFGPSCSAEATWVPALGSVDPPLATRQEGGTFLRNRHGSRRRLSARETLSVLLSDASVPGLPGVTSVDGEVPSHADDVPERIEAGTCHTANSLQQTRSRRGSCGRPRSADTESSHSQTLVGQLMRLVTLQQHQQRALAARAGDGPAARGTPVGLGDSVRSGRNALATSAASAADGRPPSWGAQPLGTSPAALLSLPAGLVLNTIAAEVARCSDGCPAPVAPIAAGTGWQSATDAQVTATSVQLSGDAEGVGSLASQHGDRHGQPLQDSSATKPCVNACDSLPLEPSAPLVLWKAPLLLHSQWPPSVLLWARLARCRGAADASHLSQGRPAFLGVTVRLDGLLVERLDNCMRHECSRGYSGLMSPWEARVAGLSRPSAASPAANELQSVLAAMSTFDVPSATLLGEALRLRGHVIDPMQRWYWELAGWRSAPTATWCGKPLLADDTQHANAAASSGGAPTLRLQFPLSHSLRHIAACHPYSLHQTDTADVGHSSRSASRDPATEPVPHASTFNSTLPPLPTSATHSEHRGPDGAHSPSHAASLASIPGPLMLEQLCVSATQVAQLAERLRALQPFASGEAASHAARSVSQHAPLRPYVPAAPAHVRFFSTDRFARLRRLLDRHSNLLTATLAAPASVDACDMAASHGGFQPDRRAAALSHLDPSVHRGVGRADVTMQQRDAITRAALSSARAGGPVTGAVAVAQGLAAFQSALAGTPAHGDSSEGGKDAPRSRPQEPNLLWGRYRCLRMIYDFACLIHRQEEAATTLVAAILQDPESGMQLAAPPVSSASCATTPAATGTQASPPFGPHRAHDASQPPHPTAYQPSPDLIASVTSNHSSPLPAALLLAAWRDHVAAHTAGTGGSLSLNLTRGSTRQVEAAAGCLGLYGLLLMLPRIRACTEGCHCAGSLATVAPLCIQAAPSEATALAAAEAFSCAHLDGQPAPAVWEVPNSVFALSQTCFHPWLRSLRTSFLNARAAVEAVAAQRQLRRLETRVSSLTTHLSAAASAAIAVQDTGLSHGRVQGAPLRGDVVEGDNEQAASPALPVLDAAAVSRAVSALGLVGAAAHRDSSDTSLPPLVQRLLGPAMALLMDIRPPSAQPPPTTDALAALLGSQRHQHRSAGSAISLGGDAVAAAVLAAAYSAAAHLSTCPAVVLGDGVDSASARRTRVDVESCPSPRLGGETEPIAAPSTAHEHGFVGDGAPRASQGSCSANFIPDTACVPQAAARHKPRKAAIPVQSNASAVSAQCAAVSAAASVHRVTSTSHELRGQAPLSGTKRRRIAPMRVSGDSAATAADAVQLPLAASKPAGVQHLPSDEDEQSRLEADAVAGLSCMISGSAKAQGSPRGTESAVRTEPAVPTDTRDSASSAGDAAGTVGDAGCETVKAAGQVVWAPRTDRSVAAPTGAAEGCVGTRGASAGLELPLGGSGFAVGVRGLVRAGHGDSVAQRLRSSPHNASTAAAAPRAASAAPAGVQHRGLVEGKQRDVVMSAFLEIPGYHGVRRGGGQSRRLGAAAPLSRPHRSVALAMPTRTQPAGANEAPSVERNAPPVRLPDITRHTPSVFVHRVDAQSTRRGGDAAESADVCRRVPALSCPSAVDSAHATSSPLGGRLLAWGIRRCGWATAPSTIAGNAGGAAFGGTNGDSLRNAVQADCHSHATVGGGTSSVSAVHSRRGLSQHVLPRVGFEASLSRETSLALIARRLFPGRRCAAVADDPTLGPGFTSPDRSPQSAMPPIWEGSCGTRREPHARAGMTIPSTSTLLALLMDSQPAAPDGGREGDVCSSFNQDPACRRRQAVGSKRCRASSVSSLPNSAGQALSIRERVGDVGELVGAEDWDSEPARVAMFEWNSLLVRGAVISEPNSEGSEAVESCVQDLTLLMAALDVYGCVRVATGEASTAWHPLAWRYIASAILPHRSLQYWLVVVDRLRASRLASTPL